MDSLEIELAQCLQFEDVTTLFHSACEEMTVGDMLHSEKFNLFDSMSSSELCDPKMDLKCGYKDIKHPSAQVDSKIIKRAEDLSNLETMAIMDQLMAQEFMWLKGYSLSQTLYKFIYFYDKSVYEKLPAMKSYIDALFLSGAIIYDTLRLSPYLREDDYIVTVFGFPKTEKEQELVLALTAAEEGLQDQTTNPNSNNQLKWFPNFKSFLESLARKKKNIKMNEFDGIDSRLKYRKAFLKLVSLMSEQVFSPTVEDQIQAQINRCKKCLEEIKQTQELYQGLVDITPYFQKDLNKTLNCLISPRPNVEATIAEGLSMADNFFAQLEFIISLSKERDFQTIIERIKDFMAFPKNILSKGYLDINIFVTQGKYFSQFSLAEMVKNIFKDYGLKDSHFATPGYKDYSNQCCIVIQEYMAKYLRNPCRQYRDFSRLYQDLSILVSSSDKYEKENLQKKDEQQIATGWCYNTACKLMSNQLHLGFQLELFDQADYSQIFFALEFIYNILENNCQLFMLKVDKPMMHAFYQKQNVDAQKKKLKPFQKKIFNQFIFYKGMQIYCKASARLCYVLEQLKIANEFNDAETKRNRFINRFKIFENVFYIKFSSYEQFVEKVSEICPDVSNTEELSNSLLAIKDMFTQAQQLFQKVPQDDETIPASMKSEASKLVRICVMSSMTALKIKMKLGKLGGLKAIYKNLEHPWYPNLDIA